MQLKDYQEKVLEKLKEYLGALSTSKTLFEEVKKLDPNSANYVDFPKRAFEESTRKINYYSRRNGLGEPLPDVYFKIPTGGGKTILACHAMCEIHKKYLQKQNGLVLWIVPSNQIYRQTINHLKDRNSPYRQFLEIASGGKVLIREKTQSFNLQDVQENLVILMLMLPSANRQNKETLKIFKDKSGFTDFFPAEDDFEGQSEMIKKIPNLDCFFDQRLLFGNQIKTSLGNALKTIKPLIIIDEGHKAFADLAQKTIENFNPSFILQLSATPPEKSNKLVEVSGRDLHKEEMIKLDIHLSNKASVYWQDVLLASFEKRNYLEEKAKEYGQNNDKYIRPICLIQVERTGKDQQGNGFVHADDAKEYLIKKCGVLEEEIAIKSSNKDDIEGVDLFSSACQIRYIITKQALAEGWDCSFAYCLAILTNPSSATGITQLIGRILRQPFAKKTGIVDLDECYIFAHKPSASKLIEQIKKGLEDEGMGDIVGNVVGDDEFGRKKEGEVEAKYRENFKQFAGKIYLPKFVIQEEGKYRDIMFEADILSKIDWQEAKIKDLKIDLNVNEKNNNQEFSFNFDDDQAKLIRETFSLGKEIGNLKIDETFLARQLGDIIPNPWIAFELGREALKFILEKNDKNVVAGNFVVIIEELKKFFNQIKNRLAEDIFKKLLDDKKLCFFLICEDKCHLLPSNIKIKSNKQLVRDDNSAIQQSLFDYVADEDFNGLEKAVAVYLDEQEQLLWWYRNRVKKDFYIQGWQKNKIYPDFIASSKGKNNDKVYVLETKGVHLKGNDDTAYKQDIFKLCNKFGVQKKWQELFDDFPNREFEFQVIYGDEWQSKINQLFKTN